jgi:8-amino-7-oxononanoate synthase
MSNKNLPGHIIKALKEREQKGALRKLKAKFPEIDFCSNDYLGFSKLGLLSAKLQIPNFKHETSNGALNRENKEQKTLGSGGSRLISGNSELFEEAEKQIALFHHGESALIFNSGYDANIGLFSSVPQKNDLVLFDECIHASIYDGIRLSHANHFKFKHNDINSLLELIGRHKNSYTNIFIAVESVYSMDGDTAPLLEIVDVCKKNENVFLIVDEAHAIGIFGKQGRGLCSALDIENNFLARVFTYGKAMGCHGAAIVGSNALRNYLINFSRPFIYTTALPHHSIDAILAAYKLLIETNQSVLLKENISYFYSKINSNNKFIKSHSPIQSFIAGSNILADELEKVLAEKNIYAKAIKSPTVKEGTERVRFCIHAFNTKKEIDLLAEVLNIFGN